MFEWILVIWLMVPGGPIPEKFQVGEFESEARCVASRDSIVPAEGVTFVAKCEEREK